MKTIEKSPDWIERGSLIQLIDNLARAASDTIISNFRNSELMLFSITEKKVHAQKRDVKNQIGPTPGTVLRKASPLSQPLPNAQRITDSFNEGINGHTPKTDRMVTAKMHIKQVTRYGVI